MKKRIYYNPRLTELARKLRKDPTKAEIRLWSELKGNQFFDYDFHRQKPIDEYIVDFYCYDLMLVIEVDGLSHTDEMVIVKDSVKQRRLEELGFTVLHFNDNEVMNDMENVLREIEFFVLNFEEKRGKFRE